MKNIKLGNSGAKERTAAEQEASLLSQLQHPNIVSYKESFQDSHGVLHIVMGYCEGGDLCTRLKAQKGVRIDNMTSLHSVSVCHFVSTLVQLAPVSTGSAAVVDVGYFVHTLVQSDLQFDLFSVSLSKVLVYSWLFNSFVCCTCLGLSTVIHSVLTDCQLFYVWYNVCTYGTV